MTHHSDMLETWLRLPSPDGETLRQYGISHRAGLLVGGLRVGRNGLLIPCFADPPSIFYSADTPLLYAIIAVNPAEPDCWKLVAGDTPVMFGESALREAVWYGEPLPVFRNPASWTRSGGAGVCPLDLERFAREVLWRPEIEMVAEDIETGDRLKRALDRAARVRKPKITVTLKDAA